MPKPKPFAEQYPLHQAAAQKIADDTCVAINAAADKLRGKTDMPYNAQAILEATIQILQARV